VARSLAGDLPLAFDSAGTADWHRGKPPYGPMQAAAARRGYDLSGLRARAVTPADLRDFDLIVAMDADNLAALSRLPGAAEARLALLTAYDPQRAADHVPDPYYTRDFDGALALIERCVKALIRAEAPA